jgi:hypothetical protein
MLPLLLSAVLLGVLMFTAPLAPVELAPLLIITKPPAALLESPA